MSYRPDFRFLGESPRTYLFAWVLLLGIFCPGHPETVQAQNKEKKKEDPRILLINPVGAAPGQKVKMTLRGMHLDQATGVSFSVPEMKAKILNKSNAPVPDNNPEQAGNTQVVVEVTVPQSLNKPKIFVTVETAKGKSPPHDFLIENELPVIAEKENNDGFMFSQKVSLPQVIDGEINRRQDVDVFSFEGKKGQQIVIEVLANRQGSVLDSMVMLYDQNGQQLDFHDDLPEATDSGLEVTLPNAGTYFLSLIDAHDRGGPTHPYRLVIREKPS